MGFLMKPPHKVVAQNKAGRPPTREDPLSAIRLPPKLTAAIDKWTEENGVTSRSEAIRRLVGLGLAAASQPLRRRNLEAASKALQLAAQEIDKLLEPSIPEEERHRRKRRLLKGPKEFRDIRGDLSK
jgi:Arc/MetJ-type ribon-helix-helix transcriptional regulator